MDITKMYILVIVGIVTLFVLGGFLGEECASIGQCRGCWSRFPAEVESDLCSNKTCTPDPFKVQHNAFVDVILCGCEKAIAEGCKDSSTLSDIEKVYTRMSGYKTGAATICGITDVTSCERGSASSLLAKWRYD